MGRNNRTIDATRLQALYETHRAKSERAFATLRSHLDTNPSAKKNSLAQFVAAIKEGAVDEEQFPQLTSWLDAYA